MLKLHFSLRLKYICRTFATRVPFYFAFVCRHPESNTSLGVLDYLVVNGHLLPLIPEFQEDGPIFRDKVHTFFFFFSNECYWTLEKVKYLNINSTNVCPFMELIFVNKCIYLISLLLTCIFLFTSFIKLLCSASSWSRSPSDFRNNLINSSDPIWRNSSFDILEIVDSAGDAIV